MHNISASELGCMDAFHSHRFQPQVCMRSLKPNRALHFEHAKIFRGLLIDRSMLLYPVAPSVLDL